MYVQKPSEEYDSDGPQLLRKKRATQAEKNTCQLYIQTDHLFYKHYGTREAVIAQVFLSPLFKRSAFILFLTNFN